MTTINGSLEIIQLQQELADLREYAGGQSCTAVSVEVRWSNWFIMHLAGPMALQLMLGATASIFNSANSSGKRRWLPRQCRKFIMGMANRMQILMALYTAEIICSVISILIWAVHTYWRDTAFPTRVMMRLLACVDLATWTVNRLQNSFTPHSFWELNALVDAVTIVPTFCFGLLQGTYSYRDGAWLSLHFLRSYSMLDSFKRLQETGIMVKSSVIFHFYMPLIFELVNLLVIMSGSVFTSEVLGDPPFLQDKCVETENGDRVSLFTMMYWIVISITTVGFGDYVPRSTLARILTSIFIVIGISAVYSIQYTFVQMWSRYQEGSGSYRVRQGVAHVVVVLGTRGRPTQLSSLVTGFLREIFALSHRQDWEGGTAKGFGDELGSMSSDGSPRPTFVRRGTDWPDVVFFAPALWDSGNHQQGHQGTTFEEFLRTQTLPTEAMPRIKYLVGNVTSKADLDRAAVGDSTLTFILTHMNSDAPDEDDRQNIFTAMVLRDLYPGVRLRLMLLRPESKNIAVQSGIEVTRCFSAQELKAALLAQNVRCQGMLPSVIGLFTSVGMEDAHSFLHGVYCHTGSTEAAEAIEKMMSDGSEKILSASIGTQGFHRKGKPIARGTKAHTIIQLLQKEDCEDHFSVSDLWKVLYFQGLASSVFGFELAAEFEGSTFGEMASKVFTLTEAVVIGIFEGGRLVICPQDTHLHGLRRGQICFAVAQDLHALDPVRLEGSEDSNWRTFIYAARQLQMEKIQREGAHTAAVRLMKHELAKRVVGGRDSKKKRSGSVNGDVSVDFSFSAHGNYMQNDSYSYGSKDSPRGASTQSPRGQTRFSAMSHDIYPSSGSMSQDLLVPSAPSKERVMDVNLDSRDTVRSSVLREQTQQLRRLVKEEEELVVLCVCRGEVWQQVRTFVNSLRCPYEAVQRPVVVLAPTPPPRVLVEECGEGVAFLTGSCLSAKALFDAGMLEARAIVTLSGEPPPANHLREVLFRDYQAVLTAQELECWCGCSRREIFTTYELQNSTSVRHLPARKHMPAANVEKMLLGRIPRSGEEEERGEHSVMFGGLPRTDTQLFSNYSWFEKTWSITSTNIDDKHKKGASEESILFDDRFSAGQVFTPELWGAMLGFDFYMPATIELMEALLIPHLRGQSAYPWQIRVPQRYVGGPFSRLFHDLILGGWDRPETSGSLQVSKQDVAKDLELVREAVSDRLSCSTPGGEGEEAVEDDESRRALPGFVSVIPNAVASQAPDTPSAKSGGASWTVTHWEEDFKSTPPQATPQATPQASPSQASPPPGSEETPTHGHLGPALPIGIYRPRRDGAHCPLKIDEELAMGTGDHNYNILTPPANLSLGREDWILVLGSERFRDKAASLGLLKGISESAWEMAEGEHWDPESGENSKVAHDIVPHGLPVYNSSRASEVGHTQSSPSSAFSSFAPERTEDTVREFLRESSKQGSVFELQATGSSSEKKSSPVGGESPPSASVPNSAFNSFAPSASVSSHGTMTRLSVMSVGEPGVSGSHGPRQYRSQDALPEARALYPVALPVHLSRGVDEEGENAFREARTH